MQIPALVTTVLRLAEGYMLRMEMTVRINLQLGKKVYVVQEESEFSHRGDRDENISTNTNI